MNRLLPALLFVASPITSTVMAAATQPDRPNIIYVMVDQMGYADIGPYGQEEIRTPALDRMAQEGITFTAAYAGASVCAPSRSVLMTGQHLGHTRVRGNSGFVGGVFDHRKSRRVPLELEDVTVAEVLKARGYVTGMTGKWGLGEPGTTGEPNRQGFDEWFGFLNQSHAHTHYPDYLWRNQQKEVIAPNLDGKRGRHSHDLFTEFALDFVRRRSRAPFFLYLPYTLTHPEYAVPSLGDYAEKPWGAEEKVFAAMVGMIDRDMGRIFALLQELGIDERTIVFFCSDNGAYRRHEGRFDSNRGLRGSFGDIYDGGLRVPMIVRWPGRTPPGARSDLPWTFADVLPTLADIAGAPIPPGVDGVSVLPDILGRRQNLDRMLYWEQYASNGFQQAVRWGKWKSIRSARSAATFELYDLSVDSAEQTNVAAMHRAVLEKIAAFMDRAHVPSPHWPEPMAKLATKKAAQAKP